MPNLPTLFYLLGLVLLEISIFPVSCRVSLLSAGLTSALLGFLLTWSLPFTPVVLLVGVALLFIVLWLHCFNKKPVAPAA